jgi:hypothetical protein
MQMTERLVINSGRAITLSVVVLAVLGLTSPLLADPADWSPALKQQLAAENGCKVLYILNVREYRVTGHDVVHALAGLLRQSVCSRRPEERRG